MKRVLIIAGSDSGGGAGIQADLKTVSAFGVWGMTAVTAVTAQSTQGVTGIHEVPAEFVGDQIRTVLEDIGADAVKIGMLQNAAVVEEVAAALGRMADHRASIVLDPVMVAKGGASLLEDQAVDALKSTLIPCASLVTPNVPEAERLSGLDVRTVEDMERAGREILTLGARAVLVKGGHHEGAMVVDVLVLPDGVRRFSHARLDTANTHGTGCTMSSAIAALLARGESLSAAVAEARRFVRLAMRAGPPVGQGHRPLDHLVLLKREAQRHQVLESLRSGYQELARLDLAALPAESHFQLVHAIPWAEGPEDVAAYPGPVVYAGETIVAPAAMTFGSAGVPARTVLTVMRYRADLRSSLTIRGVGGLPQRLRDAGLTVVVLPRRGEEARRREKAEPFLDWGVDAVLANTPSVPDAFYEDQDESLVRMVGADPADVVAKVRGAVK